MHIDGVGMMFILILPVAYVHLEDITSLPSSKQLRVMSAGVWHNVIQALTAYIILMLLPTLMYPFFTVGHGVITTKINQVKLDYSNLYFMINIRKYFKISI